MEVSLGR